MSFWMHSSLGIALFFAVGAAMGSFGNVLSDRLMNGGSILGRSACDACKKRLGLAEMIPVASWLWLRGRCAACRTHIPARFAVVELLSGILFAVAASTQPAWPQAIAIAFALWSMLLIADIDLRTQRIPDVLTIILGMSAAAYRLLDGSFAVSGAVLGMCFFAAQFLLSRGKWVGSGDVLLGAALGVLLGGWQPVLVMLLASYVIGAVVAAFLLASGHARRTSHVPFGPFLVAGACIAFFAGDTFTRFVL